jgi:hypothetical protein
MILAGSCHGDQMTKIVWGENEHLMKRDVMFNCFVLFRVSLHTVYASGFGGLVVSMLASGTQDREFKPCQSHRIFWAKKSSACLPSEGK